MKQYGTASVYGVDGVVTYVAAAQDLMVESAEGEQGGSVEEFKDGNDELIGANVRDERDSIDLVLIPKKAAGAGSLDAAKAALKYPAIWSKVVLSGFVDTSTPSLGINGDYIYPGGARRTIVRGQAAMRLRVFKTLTSQLTNAQLTTLAT